MTPQNSQINYASDFGLHHIPEPLYNDITTRSIYVPMRDGVKIAIDIILPAGLSAEKKIPTLVSFTRYWRDVEIKAPFQWLRKRQTKRMKKTDMRYFFGMRGYALVVVDVRGTGASFGALRHPWSPESIEDEREIVNWIVSQPWSNGKVGGYGTSYGGTTAEYLAIFDHPAVRVVIPKFNHPDGYQDIAFPGGLFNDRFIKYWGYFDYVLDRNIIPKEFGWQMRLMLKGVKPVDGEQGKRLLRAATREHQSNGDVYELSRNLIFRDEQYPEEGVCLDDLAVHHFKPQLEKSQTFIHGWASWMDAGTADAVIRRFLTFPNASRAVIGAWDHGGHFHASPFQPLDSPPSPSPEQQLNEMLHIFDAFLKIEENTMHSEKALHYYTMGEERWKKTETWPPIGTENVRWYLGDEGSLSQEPPDKEVGEDANEVDFQISSGQYNRWWEMGIFERKSVIYPDRSKLEGLLLTYTSSPFENDVEISGHPVITLYASSSEPDTAFYVYLEDVDLHGRVTYITEGMLRSIHRRISHASPPYDIPIPYHSYREKDALPLIPGEISELTFGLFGTSALINKGHCIRISIAGHDQGTFKRVPDQGTPKIVIVRNRLYPSCIDLPMLFR
jgi:putative CocE/NonD family hydrolase